MHALARFVTDFGDTAVTVPVAAVTVLLLIVLRRPRLALGWGASIVACAGAIAALKLVLGSCAYRIAIPGIASPSGHAAMSTAVYGGFVLLLGGSLRPAVRRAAYAGAAVLIFAIALSRVYVHAHSPAEVVIGLVIGLAALTACRGALAAVRPGRLPVFRLCIAAAVAIAVMHGTRWPAERAIHGLARSALLHALLPWCDGPGPTSG